MMVKPQEEAPCRGWPLVFGVVTSWYSTIVCCNVYVMLIRVLGGSCPLFFGCFFFKVTLMDFNWWELINLFFSWCYFFPEHEPRLNPSYQPFRDILFFFLSGRYPELWEILKGGVVQCFVVGHNLTPYCGRNVWGGEGKPWEWEVTWCRLPYK